MTHSWDMTHPWDMTHSRETWLTSVDSKHGCIQIYESEFKYMNLTRGMTNSWDMTHPRETWLIHVRHDSSDSRHDSSTWDMTHLRETWLIYVRHNSFTWDMTHLTLGMTHIGGFEAATVGLRGIVCVKILQHNLRYVTCCSVLRCVAVWWGSAGSCV